MDFELNNEQKADVAIAKAFSKNELFPYASRWDADSIFPKDALRAAGELGFMGMYTPERAGGLAMGRLDRSLIVEELAKGCTTTAAFLTIHNMATAMIGKYARESIVESWCPLLVSGEKLASYCLTETNAGFDAGNLQTSARLESDCYLVNGHKVFISGAGDTDVLVVMARTGGEGPKGISALLIPADSEGVQYGKKEQKMGWNAQPTRVVSFDSVRVLLEIGSEKNVKVLILQWRGWRAVDLI